MGFDFYKEVISPTLGVLYRSRDTTGDFVVICDEGKELKCHKIVLATGSPVFRAMLNSCCKEVEGSEVKVSNFRFEVMEKLIDFCCLLPLILLFVIEIPTCPTGSRSPTFLFQCM